MARKSGHLLDLRRDLGRIHCCLYEKAIDTIMKRLPKAIKDPNIQECHQGCYVYTFQAPLPKKTSTTSSRVFQVRIKVSPGRDNFLGNFQLLFPTTLERHLDEVLENPAKWKRYYDNTTNLLRCYDQIRQRASCARSGQLGEHRHRGWCQTKRLPP
jgi:hypothetical protein